MKKKEKIEIYDEEKKEWREMKENDKIQDYNMYRVCRIMTRTEFEGIYVIGFSYPVVPTGQARIRVQISAAHEKQHLNSAINAFKKVGKRIGILKKNL